MMQTRRTDNNVVVQAREQTRTHRGRHASDETSHKASGDLTIIPFDMGPHLQALLHPTHFVIDSPSKLDAESLQPVVEKTQQISLVFASYNHSLDVTLYSLHPTSLVVESEASFPPYRVGEPVLLIFPTHDHRYAILQATIADVYGFKLKLIFRDPRYDIRRRFQLQSGVQLRLAPCQMVHDILEGRVAIERTLRLWEATTLNPIAPYLTDRCFDISPGDGRHGASTLDHIQPVACALQDISLGGCCLSISTDEMAAVEINRLGMVSMTLPGLLGCAVPSVDSLELSILGVIRGIRRSSHGQTLHTCFLKRLPKTIDPLLARLEEQFLRLQRPLA